MADRHTAIRASQLRNFSITAEDLKNDSITGDKFIDLTISGSKIANTAVTDGKLVSSYVYADGTRAFSGVVVGVDPTTAQHLATKTYVDTEITTATGSLIIDHGDLTGLSADDHTIYSLTDGSRAFTSTIGGVIPTSTTHLATKGYVDDTRSTVVAGNTPLASGVNLATIAYTTAFSDLDYSVTANLKNDVDTNPGVYDFVITETTTSGFSIEFMGSIDSVNYSMQWTAVSMSGTLSSITHTHISTNITDFNEAAQDAVGNIMSGAGTTTVTYDDTNNTITVSGGGGGGHQFVDRGDPSSYDWTKTDFTKDGSYYDLDCSSIVPANAVVIYFRVSIQTTAASKAFTVRKKSNSNAINNDGIITQVDNITIIGTLFTACDANRVIQYSATTASYSVLNVAVRGWLI